MSEEIIQALREQLAEVRTQRNALDKQLLEQKAKIGVFIAQRDDEIEELKQKLINWKLINCNQPAMDRMIRLHNKVRADNRELKDELSNAEAVISFDTYKKVYAELFESKKKLEALRKLNTAQVLKGKPFIRSPFMIDALRNTQERGDD